MSRVVLALLWVIHFLPLRALAALGNAVGIVAFWLIAERREITRINLARCFPDWTEARREQLARAHFRAVCRSFIERALWWWAPRARIERLVRIEGLEYLRALAGRPAILFVPHFVGLDAGMTRLSCEVDMVAMYARQKNAAFDRMLYRGRTRFGAQRLVSRQEGIRVAIVSLREGRPLYYLPDQDYGARDALFVPFFGVPAATIPGLSRIAAMTGARVLPCVTRMPADGSGYVLTIEAPWDNFPGEDLLADTRRMNAYIESRALQMPEQYNWMHRRFKTRPPGEPGFYAALGR